MMQLVACADMRFRAKQFVIANPIRYVTVSRMVPRVNSTDTVKLLYFSEDPLCAANASALHTVIS